MIKNNNNTNQSTKILGSNLISKLSLVAAISAFVYSSSALAVVNPANLVQSGYWYADEDIRAVLKSRLNAANSYVAPALPFERKNLLTVERKNLLTDDTKHDGLRAAIHRCKAYKCRYY